MRCSSARLTSSLRRAGRAIWDNTVEVGNLSDNLTNYYGTAAGLSRSRGLCVARSRCSRDSTGRGFLRGRGLMNKYTRRAFVLGMAGAAGLHGFNHIAGGAPAQALKPRERYDPGIKGGEGIGPAPETPAPGALRHP